MSNLKLLNTVNAKTVKGEKKGYMTFILYLAPGKLSGYEVCPKSTEECRQGCLYYAGYGKMASVQKARISKTKRYFQDNPQFLNDLKQDIVKGQAMAKRKGLTPVFRLDGTSDLGMAKLLSREFPKVQFYDYTKCLSRAPSENWHITYSYSGDNLSECLAKLSEGKNVAVVFKKGLPETWHGFPVVSGDETDLRFLDAPGSVVGLYAKGPAKGVDNKFVVL